MPVARSNGEVYFGVRDSNVLTQVKNSLICGKITTTKIARDGVDSTVAPLSFPDKEGQMNIVFHTANNLPVGQRQDDGYVDATAMCKSVGKRFDNYKKHEGYKPFIKALSNSLCLTEAQLVVSKRGKTGSIWVHPRVAEHLSAWLLKPRKDKDATEEGVKFRLAKKLKGRTEVITPVGEIDILTSAELIEVKAIRDWKAALGQVLIYGDYYPSHQMRLHLFGQCHESYLDLVRYHCEKRGVTVTWEG